MSIVAVHTPNMVGAIELPGAADEATLVTLGADPVYGNAGTGPPNNGAAANDPAWPADWKTKLDNGTYARWNGTAWVVTTPPTFT